jgi:hypothetical protein
MTNFTRNTPAKLPVTFTANLAASPFWSRKVRLAILTLATFMALC